MLYLGRRHPLKGVKYLDEAVGELEVEQWRAGLFYVEGYREGREETRVKLLADAIETFAC